MLGTERHESRRIDNQLRGRSGRQGDPGESRFYLSLGDDLMRRFNGPMLESMMTTLRVPDDQPIESKMVSRAIRSAQTQVEQQNFEVRKDVLKYDEVLNRQRTVIYDERRKVLEGADLHEQVQLDGRRRHRRLRRRRDRDRLRRGLGPRAAVDRPQGALPGRPDRRGAARPGGRRRPVGAHRRGAQGRSCSTTCTAPTRSARPRSARRSCASWSGGCCSSVLDRKWREHLYEMDYLRAGIHLRAMANRDPVVEYQREGYDMFMAMLDGIKEESVGFLFNLEVKTKEEQEAEAKAKQDEAEAAALAAAQEGTARVLARQAAEAKAAAADGRRRTGSPATAPRPGGRRRGRRPPAAAAAPAVRRRSRRAPGRSWRSRASTSRGAPEQLSTPRRASTARRRRAARPRRPRRRR